MMIFYRNCNNHELTRNIITILDFNHHIVFLFFLRFIINFSVIKYIFNFVGTFCGSFQSSLHYCPEKKKDGNFKNTSMTFRYRFPIETVQKLHDLAEIFSHET